MALKIGDRVRIKHEDSSRYGNLKGTIIGFNKILTWQFDVRFDDYHTTRNFSSEELVKLIPKKITAEQFRDKLWDLQSEYSVECEQALDYIRQYTGLK